MNIQKRRYWVANGQNAHKRALRGTIEMASETGQHVRRAAYWD